MRRAGSTVRVGAMALGLAVLFCGSARAADETGPLEKVARLLGEWRIEAQWTGGEALKGRQTYEWGLNKKFIVAKTFVTKNDGSGEYQRYESVFGVKDGKLVSYNFTYDGTSSVSEAQLDGDTLRITGKVGGSGGAVVIKQELVLSTGTESRWQVWVVRDGKEEQVMDGTWRRTLKEQQPK